jgi:hypothetical protein
VEIILLGAIVGFLVGLTGMGGGALMTPLLILLGYPPLSAVGTDLVYASTVKGVASSLHKRRGNVDLELLKITVPTGITGILAGYLLISFYHSEISDIVILLLAIVLMASTSLMILANFSKKYFKIGCLICEKYCEKFDESNGKKLTIGIIAFTVGFLVMLTSIGSGTLMTFFLITLTNLRPNKIVGTDLVNGLIFTLIAGVLHGVSGNVEINTALQLILGGIFGVYIGVSASTKCSPKLLKTLVIITIGVTSIIIALKVWYSMIY